MKQKLLSGLLAGADSFPYSQTFRDLKGVGLEHWKENVDLLLKQGGFHSDMVDLQLGLVNEEVVVFTLDSYVAGGGDFSDNEIHFD